MRQARRVFYASMAALADALTAQAQPETSLAILWPDAITINLGMVGGGRLAWPQGIGEDETPSWLVFGAMIRTVSMTGAEPGANPQITALNEEGFDTVSDQLVGSFARHFMVAIDAWQEQGFASVARSYLERLPARTGPAPQHRRQWRSAAAPQGQARDRAAGAAGRGSPSRPGSIRRQRSRGREAVAHHTARSVGHLRVRESGRARRMGGVRRLRVLGRRSGDAGRQGALGLPRRLSRRRLARLVDAGADRRGERGRPRDDGRAAGAAAGRRISARPT